MCSDVLHTFLCEKYKNKAVECSAGLALGPSACIKNLGDRGLFIFVHFVHFCTLPDTGVSGSRRLWVQASLGPGVSEFGRL